MATGIDAGKKVGNWWAYAIGGDEWLLAAHALQAPQGRRPIALPGYFAAAQSFELYVKCAVARAGDDPSGHLAPRLWSRACNVDGFPLRDAVRVDLIGHPWLLAPDTECTLENEDRYELANNIGLYLALGHIVDLKYAFSGGKTMPLHRQFYLPIPEVYFLRQIHELRRWIAHECPRRSELDAEFDALLSRERREGPGSTS